ncbi:GPR1/FUN34/YaaH family transporter [Streptosporangium sp. NPDC049644]|uniref:acetate uptake transporter family protein n=1 Tax=Streptosporangium sp. NPDC049644 TaxID=3155507 RepID=UPI00343E476E
MSQPRDFHPYSGSNGPPVQQEDLQDYAAWENRARIFLQPIAAPSILGLFGLAGATLIVGAWLARWYGTAVTPLIVFPFVMAFGGLAQFLAAMWSYRARDGLATAVHGLWGTFWLAFGLLFGLVAVGAMPIALTPVIGVGNPGFAFWFLVLCLVTGLTAIAAFAENATVGLLLAVLAVGAGFIAAGFFAGSTWPVIIGGWLFVVGACIALYTATALIFESSFGRTVLPTGRYSRAANIPGRRAIRPLEYIHGQPGVKVGQ